MSNNIPSKYMTAAEAVALIKDGDTIGLIGGGGGLVEADCIFAAVEKRFLETGAPRNLSLVHSLGIGDKKTRGLNCFAHEGMVKRVIGGHWVWSPTMQALAREEKIEAYVLPGGVISQLFREIGAGRPGLISHVGLGTFVDPRLDGGRMNKSAKDDLVEVIEIAGKEYLRYKPFPVNVAIIRGSYADPQGNICMDMEPANLDAYAVAVAAHNSGGKVIVQVRSAVAQGSIPARSVRIPSAIVDAVVVHEGQMQSYEIVYDPSISGERPIPPVTAQGEGLSVRTATGSRAAEELRDGAVVNYGFGIPDAVAKQVAVRGDINRYYQTIEHGTYGGYLLEGMLFGFARNASAMIDAPSQFDFYGGGGLDISFLGFGEFDEEGNVNVSKLAGTTVGPGGFIDIAQNARKVIFCGNFDTKGAKLEVSNGKLNIAKNGDICKVVKKVDQITFSGPQAMARGQEVIFVTERAVFRLTPKGVVLEEIAPGVDLQRDILDRMGFTPLMNGQPRVMNPKHFGA